MDDEDIREVFAPLGPISIQRMFSGKGVYFQGVIVAIMYGDDLRLKADSISAPEFEAAGSTQWAYEGAVAKSCCPIGRSRTRPSTIQTQWVIGCVWRSTPGCVRKPSSQR